MEAHDSDNEVVHPEVKAHITSLISALGGASAEDDGRYKLGDDALECLRDLKRWIRFYDEKTNRMDVARCLADHSIIENDLLPILALFPPNSTDEKFKTRIALACFEIMVPLTWPMEKEADKMTVNHHRHMPVLQLAQLGYKKAIINFDGAPILHAAVRTALPSLAMPMGDRTSRNQGIIKLLLFFLRNIAMIQPPAGFNDYGDESLSSRSATIDAFSYQDIFLTLLTIASNMGEDFRTEDVILMEIIFHLVKRVDAKKLFMSEQDLQRTKGDELKTMLNKEAAMLRTYKTRAPTRHNRFGGMVWVKRDGRTSTLLGQDALRDTAAREQKMNNTKTFRPPRRSRKLDMEPKDLGPPVNLNPRANGQLCSFVEEFLDSGFNPLFQQVRKSLEREAAQVLDYHRSQFFYVVAWFLEAERMRRKYKEVEKEAAEPEEVGTYNLVAGVLNQDMFITLNRALDRSLNEKDWQELTTVMRCFTQILLTVQDMSASGNEDDEEIADNILARLFYEESTHEAVANIVRTYKDQGFEYLDACTELVHSYLRILESYSKQNVDLQVRSRKRTRRKKKAAADPATTQDGKANADDEIGTLEDESEDDEANAVTTNRERKFDFTRFARRFIPQGVVDTFVKFTRYYRDLDDSQLKRAHRYFYRIAFKQEMSVMLFRVDIIHLFYSMIKGPEPLEKSSAMFKEWEELAKQVIKRCVRKIEERPALITELLFSKINSTTFYLEYGYEKQTISSKARPAAQLDFRQDLELPEQVAIVVGALLDKSQADHVTWLETRISAAESERRAWEAAERAKRSTENSDGETTAGNGADDQPCGSLESLPFSRLLQFHGLSLHSMTYKFTVVQPDNDARRTAMFKNGHLRLLMNLVGVERLAPSLEEELESIWVLPGRLSADELRESLDLICRAESNPPTFEDGQSAADQLRRQAAPRQRASFDDDEDDTDDPIDDDEMLFEPGGPTPRAPDVRPKKKKTLKRRRKDKEDAENEAITEEQLDSRARAKFQRDLEKARKIKSAAYVDSEDDKTDDERDKKFFAQEASRQRAKDEYFGLAKTINAEMTMTDMLLDDDSEEENQGPELVDSSEDETEGSSLAKRRKAVGAGARRKTKKNKVVITNEGSETDSSGSRSETAGGDCDASDDASSSTDAMDTHNTHLSSSPQAKQPGELGKESDVDRGIGEEDANDDDDDELIKPPVVRMRPRAVGGFIIDSSEDEA